MLSMVSINLKAQSISDNIIDLSSINPEEDNHPDKLILIFDSTSLTFEFTDDGELTFISTSKVLYSNSSGKSSTSGISSSKKLSEQYLRTIMCDAIADKTDEEEEIEIQEWMIHPEGWLRN